jgi:predicted nucleic acid-binding protein
MACDAAYVALAGSLDADLVTVDAKSEKIPGIRSTSCNLRDQ